jgi:SAM-dependent methyltransferase
VSGFAAAPPNARLMQVAQCERERGGRARALDLGCGAGRNAVPLARMGWHVVGLDLSWPMLLAAAERARTDPRATSLRLALAPMDALPIGTGCADLVIAHGIWNLARSGREFRRAIDEGARVAAPGAMLFVFTFSRNTLAADITAVQGETFVFTEFSGEPQCFLTAAQLEAELDSVGFDPDPDVPLLEHNLPGPGVCLSRGGPVIYEGGFRRRHAGA